MSETPTSRSKRAWRAVLAAVLALWLALLPATFAAASPQESDSHASRQGAPVRSPSDPDPEADDAQSAPRWQLLRPDVIVYVVQAGDNDWNIARRFGLDVDTLRFSNPSIQRNPDLIFPGQEMIILPVKGAYHTVKTGESLESIARRYGVAPSDIADFPYNRLAASGRIFAGQKLIVPGGRLDYADRILPPGSGRGYSLAWPLRGTISQGFHGGHQALDIASYYGAKVYASEAGRVSYARFSSGGWLGFTATIVHENGLRTRYSHMSGIVVVEGQWVNRGQLIGYVGSTGNSTGPHVHYEVLQDGSKANPLGYLPSSSSQ